MINDHKIASSKLWILKSKGNESSFGGNLGYADELTSHYVYDTNVKNHDKIKKGDFIVIVNKKYVLGYASITSIKVRKNIPKIRYRCPYPECNTQEHYVRKSKIPKYKCRNKHEFDVAIEEKITVDEFIANYESTYKSAISKTPVKVLDTYYIRRNLYYSIQEARIELIDNLFPDYHFVPLFPSEVEKELWGKRSSSDVLQYNPTNLDERDFQFRKIPSRKGQAKFKKDLFEFYGPFCMITGDCIPMTIQASHICPYKGNKDHNPRNGLLLRADLHILYDADYLGIDSDLIIHLHPNIKNSYYKKYDCQKIYIKRIDFSPSKEALNLRWNVFQTKLKYPIPGLSNSPINMALSSSMFDSSQQVSGSKAQL